MISLNKTSKMPNLKKGNLIKVVNGASFRYSHYRNFIPDKYKNFDYQIVILLDFEKYQDKNNPYVSYRFLKVLFKGEILYLPNPDDEWIRILK